MQLNSRIQWASPREKKHNIVVRVFPSKYVDVAPFRLMDEEEPRPTVWEFLRRKLAAIFKAS